METPLVAEIADAADSDGVDFGYSAAAASVYSCHGDSNGASVYHSLGLPESSCLCWRNWV